MGLGQGGSPWGAPAAAYACRYATARISFPLAGSTMPGPDGDRVAMAAELDRVRSTRIQACHLSPAMVAPSLPGCTLNSSSLL